MSSSCPVGTGRRLYGVQSHRFLCFEPLQEKQIVPVGALKAENFSAPVLIGWLTGENDARCFELGIRLVYVRDEETDVVDAGRIVEQTCLCFGSRGFACRV